jgi:hypothetical protein
VNTATKITELPALTADLLQSNSCLVDNLFADLWKQMGNRTDDTKGNTNYHYQRQDIAFKRNCQHRIDG